MSGSAPFRLNRSGLLLALISAGFAGQALGAAARVDFTVGGVTVTGSDGRARALAKGTELDSGDTVRTTTDGRAQLRFSDGSYVSLQPNTDFAINDYKYEGKNDDRGFFGLLRGAMRTVTGAVGKVNRNSYRITTPTATVGIRGTGGVIQVLNDGATLVIGTSGIWSLTNPAGSIDIPAGISGLAPREPNTPPRETNTQPQTKPVDVQAPKEADYRKGEDVDQEGKVVAVPTVLVSGTGFAAALAFAGGTSANFPQLVSGGNATAVFDATGQLTSVTVGGSTYKMGGSQVDFGTDSIIAWGRWLGPMTTDSMACGAAAPASCSATFGPNQGLHYVIGVPTASMPTTGSASYTLMGATQPTDGTNLGTFSGTLGIVFGASHSITGNFNVAIASKNYAWGFTTSSTNALFNASSTIGCGATCACGCTIGTSGFFAGASAERAGVAYHIQDQFVRDVFGAAAFKKN